MTRRRKEDKRKTPKKRFALLKAVAAWLINLWPVWVVSLIVILVGLGVYSYLYNSPQFEVRDVEIKDSGRALDKLQKDMEKTIIGTNIFQLNIEFISEKLEHEHPEISRAKVIRKLPNNIMIELKLKRPLAQLKIGRHYAIGEGGVVLPPGGSILPYQDLPYLLGVNVQPSPLRLREQFQSMDSALRFIKVTTGVKLPPGCIITAIDSSNPKEVTFYTSQAIEVRLGEDGFEDKLSKLALLWPELTKGSPSPRRIDLRYPDARIK